MMNRFFLALVLLGSLRPSIAAAQDLSISLTPPSKDELVTMIVRFDEISEGEIAGHARISIRDTWHVNSVTPTDEFAIPTKLEITSDAFRVTSLRFPPHLERSFSFAGGDVLAVYEGTFNVPFRAVRLAPVGSWKARLYYQACDDKVCLPPRELIVQGLFPPGGQAAAVPPAISKPDGHAIVTETAGGGAEAGESTVSAPVPEVGTEASEPTGEFTPLDAAPADAGQRTELFSGDIAGVLETRGLLLTLLVVFLLGLGLNLTPCVYPLIPITVGYFASQTEGKRSRQIALSVAYVLGLAVTYSALGVFAALSGQLFGIWLQQPSVLIFFAILMLVLASSMFGLWDIRVPQFIARRSGARAGLVGAATMGLLAGVVAAPCVGPFIISLIALVGQSADVGLGFLLFFILALGLGTPYLILGTFSTAMNAIPRSGPWMVQIKKAMGFILIAMAFYFLRPIIGDTIYEWGIGLSLIVGAFFLFAKRSEGTSGNRVRIAAGVLLLAAGLWFVWPRPVGPEVEWTPYDESALVVAAQQGKPVMIDFYADWCLPCKELDNRTFNQPEVVSESERFVRLKADLTRSTDASTQALTEQYGILGVPTIVFIDSSGSEIESSRLVGFEEAPAFLARMKTVR